MSTAGFESNEISASLKSQVFVENEANLRPECVVLSEKLCFGKLLDESGNINSISKEFSRVLKDFLQPSKKGCS